MNIKLKILIFTLIAVLAPFSVLGYFAYTHSLKLSQARFGQELMSLGSLVAGEAGRHIERLLTDVGAFSQSPLLRQALTGEDKALLRVKAYFTSLRSRFPDYLRFSLVDDEGVCVDVGVGEGGSFAPERRAGVELVEIQDAGSQLRLTVPVENSSAGLHGYLVAHIRLQVLRHLLENFAGKHLYLVSGGFRRLHATAVIATPLPVTGGEEATAWVFESLRQYRDHRDTQVLGLLVPTRVERLQVLAEMDAAEVYQELNRLKIRALWVLAAVLVLLMAVAYFFGASLVRPLNGLIEGVGRVAKGDLDVDLPTSRRDEIGYLSRVFNDMVERLQDSRRTVVAAQSRLLEQNKRLEELSVTDNLTGLANRRSLIENLLRYLARYRRNGRPFSVLMLDLDHFKSVNDRCGHLVGDEVLGQFANRLAESIRAVDFAARYGGEEFTLILFESGQPEAWESAERIRAQVEEMQVNVESEPVISVTASIGIAEVCKADAEPRDLLQRADAALYQAKRAGRNRVCFAAAESTGCGSLGHG